MEIVCSATSQGQTWVRSCSVSDVGVLPNAKFIASTIDFYFRFIVVFVDIDGSVNGNRLLGDLAGPNPMYLHVFGL